MRHTFSTFSSRNFLEAEIDGRQVVGMGTLAAPALMFHVRLDLIYPFEQAGWGLSLDELRCQLALETGYVAQSVSVLPRMVVSADYRLAKDTLIHVVVPLDMAKLALFERTRKGGDMSLRLDFEAFVTELAEMGRTAGPYPKQIWGIKDTHRHTVNAPVVVPRSDWLERVLPPTGYGQVLLVELPAVPIESCASLKQSFTALQQAQRLHREGFWNEAAAQCRLALEPFFEPIDPKNPASQKKLKSTWETRVGQATYTWLNECLASTKKATNKPHHETGAHFGNADALMLITVTTALVSYAARMEATGQT